MPQTVLSFLCWFSQSPRLLSDKSSIWQIKTTTVLYTPTHLARYLETTATKLKFPFPQWSLKKKKTHKSEEAPESYRMQEALLKFI